MTVKTRDVRIPIKEALPIEVGMQLNGTGTIRVNGSVLPNPLQADVALVLKDIAIRPFQPYFEKFVVSMSSPAPSIWMERYILPPTIRTVRSCRMKAMSASRD